ncbi:hypothetical protein PQQ96_33370, partial [Paraburkholderia sediminicola]|uniref:hypothetical protein n=1 Tax=Paraburkholderia sediminicola TaxID=458836 RepID=UPI0038B89BD3
MTTTNPISQFPAHQLTGIEIDGGWRVVKRLTGEGNQEGHTPGFFSVGYLVERGAEQAFLKAFDLQAVMT